ncbi:hypothetical protein ZIOFF_018194 [Zingiber officinale]|uniref:Uncharacterized protein n=1 Tax=Zingiber officinale TaxID=94328 RepID=A0A8J5LL04_ZINOF|nr:hypothetical protein ZIOFF_018194 [Zingiber officinale]
MLRRMPRMLALMAVQRHTATSKSARPSIRVQHGSLGGVPTVALISPFSTLAHAASLSVSRGHLPSPPGLGVGLEAMDDERLATSDCEASNSSDNAGN